jgi:hypothetical protein
MGTLYRFSTQARPLLMRASMLRSLSVLAVLAACGGHSPAPRAPEPARPHLEPHAEQTWYRATTICGQGPYEIELPTTGAKYGEEVSLELHAPRAVALRVEVLADGKQVASRTFGGKPENARCVADAKERLAMAHAGTSTGGGTPVETGTMVITPPRAAAPPQLAVETQPPADSTEIVTFHIPDHGTPAIKIRFWSIEPNDLEGVLFGAAHVVWQPNVPEADYEAYLRAVADRERAEADRLAAEEERRAAEWARTHPVTQADLDREHAEQERRRRADEEARRRAEEAARRREIEAALELQRREARARFCAAHPDDRGCWGAGGLRVHLDLERHQQEADAYCRAHQEDARCWSSEERSRRFAAWNARLNVKTCQPDGAPPAAQTETQPPALSPHATWRPGYYQWTECTWVWLAGQWRVPDSDIAAETTTTAPAAPPPLQTEAPPPAPVKVAVWIPGFWQWSGTAWVWIAGSWQLRPSASVEWRPAEWRARGSVHVLVPGGWIHVR